MHISLPFAVGVAAMFVTSCSTRQPAQSRALTRQDSVAVKSEADKPAESGGWTLQKLMAQKAKDDELADRLAVERDPLDFARWTDDSRPHYYYMGTKDGYDLVAHLWGNDRGKAGYPCFQLRVGELRIDRRHELTHDFSQWQEIDLRLFPMAGD